MTMLQHPRSPPSHHALLRGLLAPACSYLHRFAEVPNTGERLSKEYREEAATAHDSRRNVMQREQCKVHPLS